MASSRHLAAVMVTDMVGFAAQTQRSEAGALRLLEEHRGLVRAEIPKFHGREVKTLGDGFLIEFGSALSATECGIAILRRLDDRNHAAPADRIDLRIGIHLGEVVPEGKDILGDAVNIASRLEPLAEPGGLLISGPVFEQVQGKIPLAIQQLPTPPLKHIVAPITVYRVELPWKAPPIPTLTPWTGRDREYGLLADAYDRAVKGHGTAVIVLGEPGEGKSRLVDELLRKVAKGDLWLLRGQALRGERAVPYAPWSEAVRSFVRGAPPAVLTRAAGAHLAEIARLAPEVADRIGAAATLPPAQPELAEDRLMEGIIQFFLNLSAQAPVVLFLDDAQWADPYSQRLIRRAVKAVPGHAWLLVVAAREHDPSESPGVGELWDDCRREPTCVSVPLGRLSPPEFDRFLDSLVPSPGLAPALRGMFHERCDGNPWFAEELLRQQIEGGVLRRSDAGWTVPSSTELRIPETVQQLLRDRLERMDPATLQVLRAASVAGTRVGFSLLRQVCGLPEDLMVICVERALQARLLEERAGAGREIELAFRDALTRDVLYEQLSLVRARAYHRKVAEELEKLPERQRREEAPHLVDHFLRAGVPDKALQYSLLAAQRAVELHAHPEAEHLYRTALELMDELPTEDGRRAETLGALAKELELLGRTLASVEKYTQAAQIWEKTGEAKRASSMHSWIAMLLNDVPGREVEVVGHSEKALALLQHEGDSGELAQAYYSLAAATMRWGANPDRARELFRKSLDLAERFGRTRTEAWAAYFLAVGLPIGRKTEAMELAGRLPEKLGSTDDETQQTMLLNVGMNLFLSGKGEVEAARGLLRRAQEIARRKGVQRHVTAIALGLAELDRLSGSWSSAEAVARNVLAQEPEENLLERVEAEILLARLATSRGRLEEAATILNELGAPRLRALLASPEAVLPLAVLRAEHAYEVGQPGSAWEALAPALADGAAHEPTFSNALIWTNALYLGVAIATARHDPSGSRSQLEGLRRAARELDEPWARGWSLRAEGHVAQEQGALSEAVAAFERSLEEWEKVGWPFETAKTLLLLGEAARSAGRPDTTVSALDRAVSLFSELGADRYAQRALLAMRSH